MSEWAINAERLSKVYQSGMMSKRVIFALTDVSLNVGKGKIFGLLGPNGAGKTTFVKILLGIIRRSQGTAQVLDREAGSRECRRLIGYLPEQMRVPRHLSGIGALGFYGGLSGLSSAEISERAPELFRLVGLTGREKDKTRQYSKGMVQRLGLAQALLHRPPLLILDEPTDGLDPRARAEMREMLKTLRERDGVTIFLNSHILQEVEMVCDEVAIMHRGRLRYAGPVSGIEQAMQPGTQEGSLNVRFTLLAPPEHIAEVFRSDPQAIISAAAVTTRTNGSDLSQMPTQVELLLTEQEEVDRRIDRLRQAGISLIGLERTRVSLEDAFMKFTSSGEQHS